MNASSCSMRSRWLRVSGLELRAPLVLLLFVFRIAAGVEIDPLVPDLGDPGDRHVEKIAVVRDQHERVGIGFEIGFEPVARFEIEMVGRLVEQQQIRFFEQQFRQRDAHLPAAGELFHAPLPVVAAEAEARRARCPRAIRCCSRRAR